MATSWGIWVQRQLDKKRWRPTDAANATGLGISIIGRWLSGERDATKESVRKFAEGADALMVEACIAWECISEDEIFEWLAAKGYHVGEGNRELTPPPPLDLSTVSTVDIATELRDRLATSPEATEEVDRANDVVPEVTLRVGDAPPEVLTNPKARRRIGRPRGT